ncbi:IclR family transcriptional regulator C-terminal domain-containing protein, partial [Acinetobacter baumannii]|nr:IclR family transcriptional regulator C-terminal domain-containing protein [Acinetobacter baumannii]
MLAELDQEALDEYIEKSNFVKKTGKTITDKKKFREELEKVRKTKVAFDREENMEGLSCIASA